MKNIIILSFFGIIFSLAEPPWQKVSIGIAGDLISSLTFENNNISYGMDMLSIGIDTEISGEDSGDYYDDGGDYYDNSDDDAVSISALILMPRVGKTFPLRSSNKLHTSYKTEIYMIIPFVSMEVDGDSITEFENDIESIIDMLGLKVAYSIEYKFNEQLSISTDFGFNWQLNSIDIEGTDVSARLGNTYTMLSLNFSM